MDNVRQREIRTAAIRLIQESVVQGWETEEHPTVSGDVIALATAVPNLLTALAAAESRITELEQALADLGEVALREKERADEYDTFVAWIATLDIPAGEEDAALNGIREGAALVLRQQARAALAQPPAEETHG